MSTIVSESPKRPYVRPQARILRAEDLWRQMGPAQAITGPLNPGNRRRRAPQNPLNPGG
jgi:hypothetical protein